MSSRNSDTRRNAHTPDSDLGFYIPFSTERNWYVLEKWPVPGLEQGNYKLSLERSIVSESKAVLKECAKGWENQLDGAPTGQIWDNRSIEKMLMDNICKKKEEKKVGNSSLANNIN